VPENHRNGRDQGGPRTVAFPAHRMPPHNLEAETGLIGSVLIETPPKELLDNEWVARVKPEHFFRDQHSEFWRAIQELNARGVPPDPITVADHLENKGTYEKLGGDSAIAGFCNGVPHSVLAPEYAHIVWNHGTVREVMQGAEDILMSAYRRDKPAEELIDEAETIMFGIATEAACEPIRKSGALALGEAAKFLARREGELSGLSTPFPILDDATGGLEPGSVTVIAARPSIGKTALALRFCEHFAAGGNPPLFVSLEQGAGEIANRLVSMRSRVVLSKIRRPSAQSRDEARDINSAMAFMSEHPVYIDASPDRTPISIASSVRRAARKEGIKVVVVDYLQLMGSSDGGGRNRQEEVAAAMGAMKRTARSLNLPFIVLSQLSRRIEEREEKVPQLSDLRESGAIEQDADIVAFIHRPEFYEPNARPGEADLIVRKNRNGPTLTVNMTYLKACMRFEPRADRPEPDHGGEPF
jgi:replicative DNA helicase